jgi:uncharacterized protein (DUF1800 family)
MKFDGKHIDECLLTLLTDYKTIQVPTQEDSDINDPLVAKGKPWVNAPYENDLIDNRRGLMLKMWWAGNLLNRSHSLTAKMTLFWHNHFVTEMDVVKDSRYAYKYLDIIHRHALGNYKQLVKEGTLTPAMLVYLNGNTNTKSAPNENYARELMELFTIGKGSGSHYTESDVKAAARVLTGWVDDKETISAKFIPELHDTDDKQFSSFFGNAIIKGCLNGEKEVDDLLNLIFKQKETARFVCRNLYRWFVSGNIEPKAEELIIEPLADTFIASGFEIVPVLKQLLSSEHFFDDAFKGCIVKSPVDFLIGSSLQLDVVTTSNLATDHIPFLQYYFYLGDLGMDITNPPSVAGWPAYYQAPKYHQWWINTASLSLRQRLMEKLCSKEGVTFNGPKIKFDFIHFIKNTPCPDDSQALIAYLAKMLLAVNLNEATLTRLENSLISRAGGREQWKDAWRKFVENANVDMADMIDDSLRKTIQAIVTLPEYQLM